MDTKFKSLAELKDHIKPTSPAEPKYYSITNEFLREPDPTPITVEEMMEFRHAEIDEEERTLIINGLDWDADIGTNPLQVLLTQEADQLSQGGESPFRSDEGIAREKLAQVHFIK